MDITWLGHSSFHLRGKSVKVVTDPFASNLVGLKFPKVEADIITVSHNHDDHNAIGQVIGPEGQLPFVIAGPGEYEVKGVSVFGVSTFHDEVNGVQRGKNTAYALDFEGIKLGHLGDLGHKLDDKQLTELGDIDILFVPVGGFFTIDAKTAAEVVAQIEPKIVIPMHFLISGMNTKDFFQVTGVEPFLSQMGASPVAPLPRLSITKDKLPEALQVVLLERKAS